MVVSILLVSGLGLVRLWVIMWMVLFFSVCSMVSRLLRFIVLCR